MQLKHIDVDRLQLEQRRQRVQESKMASQMQSQMMGYNSGVGHYAGSFAVRSQTLCRLQ